MNHHNLIAVAFITASIGLGALVACGKGGEASEAKAPTTTGVTPAAGGAAGVTANKDKATTDTTPDTTGAMGGGTAQAVVGADTPRGGPAPTAHHPTGPAPKNTGDPPPDPNKH